MNSMIGETIDNYKLLEVIGRGGMGVVFKALDTNLEKIVALKMIDPFLARDDNFLRRFKTEAKALAKLQTPNIVTVHALRENNDRFFMVMEYVEAKTLSEIIKEKGAFDYKSSIPIIKQMLNAIIYAHNNDVIHRDIKPSNVLLTEKNVVKVMDFGLAKVIRQHSPEATVTHMRAGTLYYMSPEQIKGLKNVDKRSDIYSIGMTIYELLAGRVPFEKTDTEFTIQKQIVDGKLPSINKYIADIPKPLVKIIQKAIESDSEKRYQTAEEMLNDVLKFEAQLNTAIAEGKPVPSNLSEESFYKKPVFLISAGVLATAIVLLFLFTGGGGDKAVLFRVNIDTEPQGALVFLNGQNLGKSPVSKDISEKAIALRISKENYNLLDTIVNLNGNEDQNFLFALVNEEENKIENNNASVSADFGGVEIRTNPPGASIWFDNKFKGTSPFNNNKIAAGNYSLRIKLADHLNYDTRIRIEKDKIVSIQKDLVEAGRLEVSSNPSKAVIQIDGKTVGKTPATFTQLLTGNHTVVIKQDGYKDFSSDVNLQMKKTEKINAELVPVAAPEKFASCRVLIRPWGSIFVDGEIKMKDTNIPFSTELKYGKHTLKAVHPKLGTWEKVVNIDDKGNYDYVIDFNSDFEVTVTSEPNFCEIFVDGQSTGKYTPKQLKLKCGIHTIEVKKNGFLPVNPPLKINVDGDLKEPLHLKLKAE